MKRWTVILSLVLATVAAPIRAQTTRQAPLVGLRSLAVKAIVEKDAAPSISAGALQTAVEQRLHEAGLQIIAEKDAPPVLIVDVTGTSDGGRLVYMISILLMEEGSITRQAGKPLILATWTASQVKTAAGEKDIHAGIHSALDEFVNDWRAANPRSKQ